MKKFEFSLGRIRDYKNILLDREKNVLVGLMMEKNNITDRMEQLDKEFERINNEMHEEMRSGLNVTRIRLYEAQKNGMREEQRLLGDRLDFLQVSIDKQQERVSSLKMDVSGYDNLEAKKREEWNRQLSKEQDLVISEFVSQKYTREHKNY
ncbi:flagellar FliJ family protein [Ruminococcus sp. NK3A76]|uniref:flagellar FliJ family protein n=1 Tax=Ruminococcus sp. NK3A76 TaxID=877411 RepID=UPI0004906A79|nr:flagellar FliJ family protein [Ruminococcus sp. NK3A76]